MLIFERVLLACIFSFLFLLNVWSLSPLMSLLFVSLPPFFVAIVVRLSGSLSVSLQMQIIHSPPSRTIFTFLIFFFVSFTSYTYHVSKCRIKWPHFYRNCRFEKTFKHPSFNHTNIQTSCVCVCVTLDTKPHIYRINERVCAGDHARMRTHIRIW